MTPSDEILQGQYLFYLQFPLETSTLMPTNYDICQFTFSSPLSIPNR